MGPSGRATHDLFAQHKVLAKPLRAGGGFVGDRCAHQPTSGSTGTGLSQAWRPRTRCGCLRPCGDLSGSGCWRLLPDASTVRIGGTRSSLPGEDEFDGLVLDNARITGCLVDRSLRSVNAPRSRFGPVGADGPLQL